MFPRAFRVSKRIMSHRPIARSTTMRHSLSEAGVPTLSSFGMTINSRSACSTVSSFSSIDYLAMVNRQANSRISLLRPLIDVPTEGEAALGEIGEDEDEDGVTMTLIRRICNPKAPQRWLSTDNGRWSQYISYGGSMWAYQYAHRTIRRCVCLFSVCGMGESFLYSSLLSIRNKYQSMNVFLWNASNVNNIRWCLCAQHLVATTTNKLIFTMQWLAVTMLCLVITDSGCQVALSHISCTLG